MDDFYVDQDALDEATAALKAAVAETEVVIFTTYKGRETDERRSAGHLKGAKISIFADQELTIYHRHMSAQGSTWREAVFIDAGTEDQDGVTLPANIVNELTADFFGDDHELVVEAAVTPTVVEMSLRFTDHP